jgi:uncharacterized protein YxjI
MPIILACACGASYNIKDEHAGGKFQCPQCKGVLSSPAAAGAPAAAVSAHAGHSAFHRDKFLLRQKVFAISEKYSISDENGSPILWIERPARIMRGLLAISTGLAITALSIYGLIALPSGVGLAAMVVGIPCAFVATIALNPKRHVTFYGDEEKTEELLKAYQDQRFVLLRATYSVALPDGTQLAKFEKNYIHNILRKKWTVYRTDGSVWAVAKEDSIMLALLRRFLGTFYGLLRTNFIICRGESEDVLGEFNRKMTLLDHYVLDMSSDSGRYLDRRVAAALGVLLDTGESR